MSYPEKFEGYAAFDKNSVKGEYKKHSYDPKPWEEDDVDIKIQYCGICASDNHTAGAGWEVPYYPIVVGHELAGEVVKVGKNVKHLKVGDRAGVGAQSSSCMHCEPCGDHNEQYCNNGQVGTYNGTYYNDGPAKGHKTMGGYANYWRGTAHFAVKIPDGMDLAVAAPMLCGGVTVYSPLKRYGAGTTHKKVGVIGLGGLGHFAVLFANHMGAEVTVISHSNRKEEDAKKMGAKHFVVTHGDDEVFEKHARSLDIIISTTNDDKMPLTGYLRMLKTGGEIIFVGIPNEGLPQVPPAFYILNNIGIRGSAIGSPAEILEMLELAKDQNIEGWIKKWDMNEVNKAVPDMIAGNAHYRYVLVNTENGGKL